MQYELYSTDKSENGYVYFYHLSTNNITTLFFYIYQIKIDKKYIIVNNYSDTPLDYKRLRLKKPLNKIEYEKMLFECKKAKYMDIYIDQKLSIDDIYKLSLSSAKTETDFLLNEHKNQELSY